MNEIRPLALTSPTRRSYDIALLCTAPRVVLVENFLTDSECDHLIKSSVESLQRAQVVDIHTGQNYIDNVRTCSNTWLSEDPVVDAIENRIAELVKIPKSHGETLSVLRYTVGQEFKPHHDYFDPNIPGFQNWIDQQGQRIATVLLYLSDVEEGGETVFPLLKISVKPRKRNLLFFSNVRKNGIPDPYSLHAGAPITKGEKWVASKWLCEREEQRDHTSKSE